MCRNRLFNKRILINVSFMPLINPYCQQQLSSLCVVVLWGVLMSTGNIYFTFLFKRAHAFYAVLKDQHKAYRYITKRAKKNHKTSKRSLFKHSEILFVLETNGFCQIIDMFTHINHTLLTHATLTQIIIRNR